MEVKPGYKQTEIGIIPNDWGSSSLGKCLEAHPSYGINAPATPDRADLPRYLRITDISEEGRFLPNPPTSVNHNSSNKFLLKEGDITIARTGASTGKSYQYDARDGDLVYAGFLIKISPNKSIINPTFLSSYLKTKRYWNWINQTSTRSGQPGVNANQLTELEIPLPPMQEQFHIATTLSNTDALLESLNMLITKKRAIKQVTMQQLLSGKIRLPGFKGNWEEFTLGDHLVFLKNGISSRAELSDNGGVRYLHYGDIHASPTAIIDARNKKMPSLSYEKSSQLDRLQTGDLVFVDASEDKIGIGKSIEIKNTENIEIVSGLHTIAVRFDKRVLMDGFKSYLQFIPKFQHHLQKLAAGTKVYATNRSHISTARLQLPDVDEQVAISSLLFDMESEITALEVLYSKILALKEAMMQELLTGRTRLI